MVESRSPRMELTVACCVAWAGHVVVPESTSLVGIELGSTLTANDGEKSAASKTMTSTFTMLNCSALTSNLLKSLAGKFYLRSVHVLKCSSLSY